MANAPTSFHGEVAEGIGIDLSHAATLHRRGDCENVKVGDHRLALDETLALAARAD